jgi:ribosomal protein S4
MLLNNNIKQLKLLAYYSRKEFPGRKKLSYIKFRAKQKLRLDYLGISLKGLKALHKLHGLSFLSCLEKRLDVLLFRSSLSNTIKMSRMLIRHKFIYLNGKVCTSCNTYLNINDLVSSTFMGITFSDVTKIIPSYLELNYSIFSFVLVSLPIHTLLPYGYKKREALLKFAL